MSITYIINCDECGVVICGDSTLHEAIECAQEDCNAQAYDDGSYACCEECVKERDSEASHT